jgi:hypothetical protein
VATDPTVRNRAPGRPHHDIVLVDQDGKLIAKRRINDGAQGFAELLEMLTEAGDTAEDPIPVAIETPRGLLVATLRAIGRTIYAINPPGRHLAAHQSKPGTALSAARVLPEFPRGLAARGVTNLTSSDARALLAIAPTPAAGGKLTQARIAAALRQAAARPPQLRHHALVGKQALALLAMLDAACTGVH